MFSPPPADPAQPQCSREPANANPNGLPCRRRFTTQQLFAGEQEIEILHGQALYRMRLTSLGKLILTK